MTEFKQLPRAQAAPPPFGFPLAQGYIAAPAIKFRKLYEHSVIPTRATPGAACFDLYAAEERVITGSHSIATISTGVEVELPPGHVGLVCSRSGLAAKQGLFVLNAPGVIDEDYRGEIKVILARHEFDQAWTDIVPSIISKGDRIAQLLVYPLPRVEAIEVNELSSTQRGARGLGSTGIN